MPFSADSVAFIISQLEKIREIEGEEAYQTAKLELAASTVSKPEGEKTVRVMFPDLDLETVKSFARARASAQTVEGALTEMLSAQMPNLRTQAQMKVFMTCFEALRNTLDAYFASDLEVGDTVRGALNVSLDLARKLSAIAEQVKEVPEDQRSDVARTLIEPRSEVLEQDVVQHLKKELEGVEGLQALSVWYGLNRDTMDRVVTQSLRNDLFDHIRAKRLALT